MGINLEKYFKQENSPCFNARVEKAKEQARKNPVPYKTVYSYINEFLERIREDNGFTDKIIKDDTIILDGKEHKIKDNGIIIKEVKNWDCPEWSAEKSDYVKYDPKYDIIKDKFGLERVADILWFKFTSKGHLAVVAKSCDINWKKTNTCGKLVSEVKDELDDSFVFVFPLTKQMTKTKAEQNSRLRKYTSGELELAVGNYLIDKSVPIIDYYSHQYHPK